MAKKSDIQVLIDGKIITLSSYESNEHLQKIASYLNEKRTELSENSNYRHLTYEMRNILTEINIASDYFKAKKQAEILEEEIEQKNKEIYNLKHELIAAQIKSEQPESLKE